MNPSDGKTRENYEQWYRAGQAHWELAPGKQVILNALRRCCALEAPLRVLDIGCGAGDLLSAVHSQVSAHWHLHGVDFSAEAIRQASVAYPAHKWECADATNLARFPDQTFDIVCCYGSWEHFADPGLAIREASRTLKRGGWVFALLPTLGVYRTDTDQEGYYADLPSGGPDGAQQQQWNLTRASWADLFAGAKIMLFDPGLARACGANKPDVFYFGVRIND